MKMRNIKLILEYDGTDYAGWQVQGVRASQRKKTIQGTIERALEKILKEKIRIHGSGRTDAGVHAEGQVAGFVTKGGLSAGIIKKALNSELPGDIVVKNVSEAKRSFHARFSAKDKLYRYRVINSRIPSVFDRRFAAFIPYKLDLRLMRKEAAVLKGKHDFKSFQAADKKERDSIRVIRRLNLRKKDCEIIIEIEADGFLRHMARNIVGTLIEIGRGKLPPGSMKRILKARDRKRAGPTAPAKGLVLVRVKY